MGGPTVFRWLVAEYLHPVSSEYFIGLGQLSGTSGSGRFAPVARGSEIAHKRTFTVRSSHDYYRLFRHLHSFITAELITAKLITAELITAELLTAELLTAKLLTAQLLTLPWAFRPLSRPWSILRSRRG